MPKAPSSNLEQIATTIRLSVIEHQRVMRFLDTHPEMGNINQVIRLFVSDILGWFGLPDDLRERLEADAKALNKDLRGYVIHLLTRRYQELLRADIAEESAPTKKGHR